MVIYVAAEVLIFAERSKPLIAARSIRDGNEAFGREDFRAAIKSYTEAIDTDPRHAKAHTLRASAYLRLGNYERAMQDAVRAIKLGDTSLETKLVMAGIVETVRRTVDPELWPPWIRTGIYTGPEELRTDTATFVLGPLVRS